MPVARIRGANINYEVVGERGAWVALNPGGRRDMSGIRSLAGRIASSGYRVLLHDRRNCGSSDVYVEGGDESEYDIWADDLHALLGELGALPAYAGGSSSGCRTALLLALRHPEAVKGLLLWRVTGGAFACQRLANQYYGQFIEAAQAGGMAAVCATEHFAERIAANPANRDYLMRMHPDAFIAVMTGWRQYFLDSADLPVIGATADDLRSIKVPACVVPGNDRTHPTRVGVEAGKLLPDAELHVLFEDQDVDLASEGWDEKEPEMAAIFIQFLNRITAVAPVGLPS